MIQSIFSLLINRPVWALLIFQAGCDVPSSPEQHKDSLETEEDSLIPPLFTKVTVPDVSIAELRNGQVQFVKGYGFAHKSNDAPVMVATRFRFGSVSKTKTAEAIRRWQVISANSVPGGKVEAPIITAFFKGTLVDFSDLCYQSK